MTLTTVVGSSGSGKTTFLNDVHKSHKCIYIRQYHNMRPYLTVSKIPRFDPTRLPYWKIYEDEQKEKTIQVGGTMAGEFIAGLSGGQRKLMLFELICQRVKSQSDLLIVLDEPFAGVTDDFVPFIVERLEEMRKKHNILLVTNDHVETLTKMANNIITVSAIDRKNVCINDREKVDREKAIAALSIGDGYAYEPSGEDFKFFLQVELWNNPNINVVAVSTIYLNIMILVCFWDSEESSAPLVLLGAGIIEYFCINPYLMSLVEWRNAMREEAEALVHSSKGMNMFLKVCLTSTLIFISSLIEYAVVNVVIDGLSGFDFWTAMFFDSLASEFPFVALGILSSLSFQAVQILGFLPFLFSIFLSTTFSPGSGLPVVKELRYLFARFYFWCMLPSVEDSMEGCPPADMNMLFLILSSLLFVIPFLLKYFINMLCKQKHTKVAKARRAELLDDDFQELQVEMYGEQILRRFQRYDASLHTQIESINGSQDQDKELYRINL